MEPNLGITYDELRVRIGYQRGYQTDASKWAAREIEEIDFVLKDGQRMMYDAHDWSFLKPTKSDFLLPDGETSADLPDDFSYLCGDMYFVDDDLTQMEPLTIENDGKVLLAKQRSPSESSRPRIAAIRYKDKPGNTRGQTQELIWWPEADADYTVEFKYSVIVDGVSASRKHPYGGREYGQCLLMACLAASEGPVDGGPGSYLQMFQMELQKAIELDKKHGPQLIRRHDKDVIEYGNVATYNNAHS